MLKFHAVGDWPEGSVHCRWTASTFHPDQALDTLIERTWREAQRPGVQLFDGPMCRLEGFAAEPDRFELRLSRTSYRPFVGTNLHNAHLAGRIGWQNLANPVGLSCALVSADEILIMGRRNSRVAYYPNRIHPFAGALEPGEPMEIFEEIRRELREELSLGPADITAMRCLGMAEDRSLRQPEMIFLARSNRTRQQIEACLDDTEHLAVWTLAPDPAAVASALAEPAAITPVGVATILLWARHTFGPEWFEQRRAAFEA